MNKIKIGDRKGCRILKTKLDRRYKQNTYLYYRKQGHRQDIYPKKKLDRRYKQNTYLYYRKQGHRQDIYPKKKLDIKVLVIRLVLTRPRRA